MIFIKLSPHNKSNNAFTYHFFTKENLILQIKNLKYRPSKTSVYLFCSKSWSRISGQVERLFTVYHKFMLLLQFSSGLSLSRVWLCNPMNRSTPGLPVHHQLPEFTQSQVHWVSDAIQPSHPLSSPSPPAPNPSQHQSLFQWVNSSHEVAKVLEFQL